MGSVALVAVTIVFGAPNVVLLITAPDGVDDPDSASRRRP